MTTGFGIRPSSLKNNSSTFTSSDVLKMHYTYKNVKQLPVKILKGEGSVKKEHDIANKLDQQR